MKKNWCINTLLCGLILTHQLLMAGDLKQLEAIAEKTYVYAKESSHLEVQPKETENPYQPNDTDKKIGLIVFEHNKEDWFTGQAPAIENVKEKFSINLSKNETSSIVLAGFALKEFNSIILASESALPEGLANSSLKIMPVVMAPESQRKKTASTGNMDTLEGKSTYTIKGKWLANNGKLTIQENQSKAWVVKIKVDANAKPGAYEIPLAWKNEEKILIQKTLQIEIHDINLLNASEANYTFGTFAAGLDFNVAQLKQMKEHGIEGLQWFWSHFGLSVEKDGDKIKMNFSDLDRIVNNMKEAGMKGPLVFSLGNDRTGMYETRICKAFDLPIITGERVKKDVKLGNLEDPKLKSLFIEGLKQLFEHAKKNNWPEIVVLPYDEPTERLMDEHKRVVKIFRENFPQIKLYGCSMNRLNWAKEVSDTDIIVSNGDYKRIRQFTKEKNIMSWFYSSCSASNGYKKIRMKYGWNAYLHEPEGMWFWCYNYYTLEPFNPFDGVRQDSAWVICWPPLNKEEAGVEHYNYEAIREAVNDVRYGLTLKANLEKNSNAKNAPLVSKLYSERKLQLLEKEKLEYQDILLLRDDIIKWIKLLNSK